MTIFVGVSGFTSLGTYSIQGFENRSRVQLLNRRPSYILAFNAPLSNAMLSTNTPYRYRQVTQNIRVDWRYGGTLLKTFNVKGVNTLLTLTDEEMTAAMHYLGPLGEGYSVPANNFFWDVFAPTNQAFSVTATGAEWKNA